MLGTRTAASVRTGIDELSNLTDEARDCLAEVKTAAHAGFIAFGLVAIVAVAGLLIASAALMQRSTKG